MNVFQLGGYFFHKPVYGSFVLVFFHKDVITRIKPCNNGFAFSYPAKYHRDLACNFVGYKRAVFFIVAFLLQKSYAEYCKFFLPVLPALDVLGNRVNYSVSR